MWPKNTTLKAVNLLILLSLFGWTPTIQAKGFYFGQSFTSSHRLILENTLDPNTDLPWSPLTEEERKIWALPSSQGQARYDWLSERVSFLLLKKPKNLYSLFAIPGEVQYPHPDSFPQIPRNEFLMQNQETSTQITNATPQIYLKGKKARTKILFATREFGKRGLMITITSPKKGILFLEDNLLDIYSDPRDRFVLKSSFFHEARHGDGHGENLGFPHVICPAGHDYEGKLACDKSLNGAYGVGALYLKKTLENCTDCDEGLKETLRFYQLESQSRVLVNDQSLAPGVRESILEIENQIVEKTFEYFELSEQEDLDKLSTEIYHLQNILSRLRLNNDKGHLFLDTTGEDLEDVIKEEVSKKEEPTHEE